MTAVKATPTTERRATFTEKNTCMCVAAVVGLGLIVGGAILLLIPVEDFIGSSLRQAGCTQEEIKNFLASAKS